MASATSIILVLRSGQIIQLDVDCTLSESHKSEVDITTHPVESGADMTDHARLKPVEVTITALMSETPVGLEQNRRAIRIAHTDTLSTRQFTVETTSAVAVPRGSMAYVQATIAKLEAIKKAKQRFTLVTSIRRYENMMVASIVVPRDSKSGDAITFTAIFREVRTATIRTTDARIPKVVSAAKKADKGKQVATPAGKQANQSIIVKNKDDIKKGLNTIGQLLDNVFK